ncbi:complement component C8 alpha chain-like [Rhincodon typus]|uniref:complement component C8 alpha chain-like n=1 Tax=Rhincodon typus TaxID=259920 RepID=UPI00202DC053|nr:complement component C8 alpha chain-like [Rhincodon typus]
MTGIPAFFPLYALLFSSVTLLSNIEGKERVALDNDPPRSRAERAVNTPAKIACELSPWGQWSSCQPCQGLRYRSRHIVRFGQFGGRTCTDILSTEESCPLSGNCEEPPVNCGNNFQCENGGVACPLWELPSLFQVVSPVPCGSSRPYYRRCSLPPVGAPGPVTSGVACPLWELPALLQAV